LLLPCGAFRFGRGRRLFFMALSPTNRRLLPNTHTVLRYNPCCATSPRASVHPPPANGTQPLYRMVHSAELPKSAALMTWTSSGSNFVMVQFKIAAVLAFLRIATIADLGSSALIAALAASAACSSSFMLVIRDSFQLSPRLHSLTQGQTAMIIYCTVVGRKRGPIRRCRFGAQVKAP